MQITHPRLPRLRVIAIGAAALLLTGLTALSAAAADNTTVVGHVYVNNNTADHNTISAFNRYADGALTALPGSPFNIGGTGTGAITGSQGAIQLSSDKRYLLAVDAGSNQISVARVNADGSLRLVEPPTFSGGVRPVSIAVNGSLVYVANLGPGTSNYTGFRLSPEGHLSPIEDSTYDLPDDAMPGDILISPDGNYLLGLRVGPDAGPSFIDSFAIDPNGLLNPAPGSPLHSPNVGPFGSVFNPRNSSQVFVTNAHDGATKGSVSSFNVSGGGILTANGTAVANNQTGTCWAEISADGKYLFAISTGNSMINRYSIGADGSLSLIGNTAMKSGMGLRPFDARLDPSGKFLYVVDAGLQAVSVFSVDGGNLTETTASPVSLPSGVTPFGIVVN